MSKIKNFSIQCNLCKGYNTGLLTQAGFNDNEKPVVNLILHCNYCDKSELFFHVLREIGKSYDPSDFTINKEVSEKHD